MNVAVRSSRSVGRIEQKGMALFSLGGGRASASCFFSSSSAAQQVVRQNAGRGNEMEVSDLKQHGLLDHLGSVNNNNNSQAKERLRAPEPQGEDGMDRESIRRSLNWSMAVEVMQGGDEVNYKHGLDEDLGRREEALHLAYDDENHQQMLGSGDNIMPAVGLASYNSQRRHHHSRRAGDERHNFYKWG
jgi:hypothetical protein